MRKNGTELRGRAARAGVRLLLLGATLTGAALAVSLELGAQESPVAGSAVTLTSKEATLELELTEGGTRSISLREGRIVVDGEARGSYEAGGALERSWRELLRSPGVLESGGALESLLAWTPPDGADLAGRDALVGALAALRPAPVEAKAQATPAVGDFGGGPVAIAPGLRSIDELTKGIERLRVSLGRIGAQSRVSGEDLALVVHDDFRVGESQVVAGDVALLGGDLELAGTVRGDVLVLDGTLTLEEGARVEGDVLQVGGEVVTAGGRVLGEMVSLSVDLGDLPEIADIAEAVASATPDVPEIATNRRSEHRGFFGRIGRNIGHAFGGLAAVIAWWIGLGAAGGALVYFFRRRLEIVADTARLNLSRSFALGLAGQLLFVPLLLVLVVGIVTWLVIPFYVLAGALALPVGYLAIAHSAGEVLSLRRYEWYERLRLRRANSYWYVFTGLAVLLAPFAIGSALYLFGGLLGFLRGLTFFAAGVLTWAATTAGLGALLLSRAGSRSEYARAGVEDLFTSAATFGEEASGA